MKGKEEGSGEKKIFLGKSFYSRKDRPLGSAEHVEVGTASSVRLPEGCRGRLRKVKQFSASEAAVGKPNT